MLNKDDLLGVGLKTKAINVGAGEVLIREFTTADREKFEVLAMQMSSGKGAKNMKAKLIAISLVNEQGGRVFGDDEINKIAMMPSTITEKIFNEVLELNGMADDALDTAEGN